jgi:hypothetical protein
MGGELHNTTRHRVAITAAGIVVLFESLRFGNAAFFLVGIPAFLVAGGIAGGARLPWRIPARDTLLYVAISVALVLGTIAYAVHANVAPNLNNRWVVACLTAVFVFGFVVKDFRAYYHRPAFWASCALLLGAHFGVLLYVTHAGEQVPFLLFVPIAIGEMFVFYVLLGISGFGLKRPDSHDNAIQLGRDDSRPRHDEKS